MELTVNNIEDDFEQIRSFVKDQGDDVQVRGYDTVEYTDLTVTVVNPTKHMLWKDERRNLLESEIRTVRHGREPEISLPELDDKLDLDDGTFYEDIIRERISNDWDEWVRLLREDKHTRKACSLFGSEPDPPCTSRIQWLIRDDKLDLYSYNRSQDMDFAFPMDIGLFEEYQCHLAQELSVGVGIHRHTMTSAHIYL